MRLLLIAFLLSFCSPHLHAFHVAAYGGNPATYADIQWGLRQIRAPKAWKYAQGDGVKLCDIDTGITAAHPDVAGKIVDAINTNNPKDPANATDGHGHGTFVAGEMVANGTLTSGVAPHAKLLIVKALDDTGAGDSTGITGGIFWCVAHGAAVINMSLSGDAASYDGYQDAINYACDHNVMVSAAAGNDGGTRTLNPATIPSPCLIAVNATDKDGLIAGFSNYGENTRELSAPGQNILGDLASGGVTLASGTSMAAPLVAGAMGLLAQLHVPAIKAVSIILATARNTKLTRASRSLYGAGILDVNAALVKALALGYK